MTEDWLKAVDAAGRALVAEMPDELAALRVMLGGYMRLGQLGWKPMLYAPKDGSEIQVIEAGSTGIHRCFYSGEWPEGGWFIAEDGDLWPSQPILFKRVVVEPKEGDAP